MGVKEELEALRNRGVTKKNASKLKDASGLSTPEAEENAIKAEQERTRIGYYGKEAETNLKSYNEAKIAVKGGCEGLLSPTKSPIKPTKVASPQIDSKKTTITKVKEQASSAPVAPAAVASPPAPTTANDEKVDEVPNLEEVPDMEEVPSIETGAAAPGSAPITVPAAPAPINRAERKSRRMMEKLGMKKVPGISQVVLKMRGGGARGGVFTIAAPDVFEKNGSYVVFGEARQGGGGTGGAQAQQAQAIQQLAALSKSDGGVEMSAGGTVATANESGKIEEVDDAAVDESGLDAKDISLVVTQAGCSRSKAVQALKDNDGDLVNAIMSLTA
jgi:nascent polypeptide-associated complex subunit alpha